MVTKGSGLALVVAFGAMLAVSLQALAAPAQGPLAEYLGRPEPSFGWKKVAASAAGPVRTYDLVMTSQVWRGIPWTHEVHVFVPQKPAYPDCVLLMIYHGSGPATGDSMDSESRELGVKLAEIMGAPVAILTHVPNEPLLDGLSEDALISYTFAQYLETGDATWPLLLPMTKSAIKAMDSVQQFMAAELKQEVRQFVVTGASKRGWTTWLTAASGDPRVKAIIPMVFDFLNLAAQMPHQLVLWGGYSWLLGDYTARGIQDQSQTARGLELASMVDPYAYRGALSMPKLVVNGANDPYWTTDAVTLYWEDLIGPKALLDVPNAGHGLEDQARVISTEAGFFRAVAGGKPFPYPTWQHHERADKLTITITSAPAPSEGRIWVATSPTKDFRQSKWTAVAMTRNGNTLAGDVPKPATGSIALFGEATYSLDGTAFNLSTAPRIYSSVPKLIRGHL